MTTLHDAHVTPAARIIAEAVNARVAAWAEADAANDAADAAHWFACLADVALIAARKAYAEANAESQS